MPLKHGIGGGTTCADCYFSQELLCARMQTEVCPTFRATVGGRARAQQRTPQQPQQAQLVPVAQQIADGTHLPIPEESVAEVQAMPFLATSLEATFSVREAAEGGEAHMVVARDVVAAPTTPTASMRAAAAQRSTGSELVVDVAPDDMEESVTVPFRTRVSSPRNGRSARVALRVAERYPNASLF